jgi:hypothetical protein
VIRAKFYDSALSCVYETPVFAATFPRLLSKSGQWSIRVPLTQALYDLLSESLTAEIWYGQTYCIGGKVQEIPIKYDLDAEIEIKGREELDEIYDDGADSTLYINNKLYILQLFTLLERSGWRLGLYQDIDRTKLITADLRKSRNRLTQISELIKLVPELRYRFGGFDYAGQPLLDVSFFDDPFRYQVLPASPGSQKNSVVIQDVASNDNYTTRIYALEPIGGDVQISSTVKRTILLSDLLNYATLSLSADYPIYEEFSELVHVVVPTVEGPIGGKVQSVPAATSTVIAMGSSNASENFWSAFIFHPYPGLLTEVSFWGGNITPTLETAIRSGANPMLWEVREVDESNVLATSGTLLGSGTVDNAWWATNSRCRIPLSGITLLCEPNKRYMFRVGLTAIAAVANTFSVRTSATNAAKSFRFDRAIARGSSSTTLNHQPAFEAITVGTVPPVGARDKVQDTRFAPQKEGADATTTDIRNAALALYEWSKLQLETRSQFRHDLTVTLAGFNLDWRPGDVIRVLAQTQFVGGRRAEWETRTIESIEYSFADNTPRMAVKFLPNTADPEEDNETIALYDEQKKKETPPEGKIIEPPYSWEMTELSQTVQFKVPDTTLSDGTPAVTVSFALTPAVWPQGETQIIGTPYGIHTNTAIQIVVEVTAKSETAVTCKIAVRDVGWNLYDEAIIYLHQVWR